MASLAVVANLCCPLALNVTGQGEFFSVFEEECRAQCQAESQVEFYVDGAPKWLERVLPGPGQPPPVTLVPSLRGLTVVHFLRHPVDLVVSGYLYHKDCREPWTKRLSLVVARIPADLHSRIKDAGKGSYCQFLQAVGEDEGMRTEAQRTLGAKDGLTRILKNFEQFKAAAAAAVSPALKPLRVVNVCLDHVDWADVFKELGLPHWQLFSQDVHDKHKTAPLGNERRALAVHARAALEKLGALKSEAAFPCPCAALPRRDAPGFRTEAARSAHEELLHL